MANQNVARLSEKNDPYRVGHLKFVGAGHAILPTMIPAQHYMEGPNALGGTAENNARAFAKRRPQALSYFEEAFKAQANQMPSTKNSWRLQGGENDRSR